MQKFYLCFTLVEYFILIFVGIFALELIVKFLKNLKYDVSTLKVEIIDVALFCGYVT